MEISFLLLTTHVILHKHFLRDMIVRFSIGNRNIKCSIKPGTTLESVRQKFAVMHIGGQFCLDGLEFGCQWRILYREQYRIS